MSATRPLANALRRADRATTTWLQGQAALEHPKVLSAVRDITALGSDTTLVLGALTLGALQLYKGSYSAAASIIMFLALARASGWLLKLLIRRERPPNPVRGAETFTSSFPSMHTANALYLTYALVHAAIPDFTPVASAVAAGAATLVGATRLILRVHWLTDVMGGFLLGALASAAGSPLLPLRS